MGLSVSPVQVLDGSRFRILKLSLANHYGGDSTTESQLLKSSVPDDNNNNNNNDHSANQENWIPFSDNLLIRNPESAPIQFTLDPNFYDMVLKVPYSDSITFKFSLKLVLPMDNLTFISANSVKELDSFLNTELFHNPNLQNEDNVVLVPNLPSSSASSADDSVNPSTIDFEWTWHRNVYSVNGMTGRKFLCFAEYSRRDHKLIKLYTFSLWIDHPPSAYQFASSFSAIHDSSSHTSLPGTAKPALPSSILSLNEMIESTSLGPTDPLPMPVTNSSQIKQSSSLNSINPISSSISSISTVMSPTGITRTPSTTSQFPTSASPSFAFDLNPPPLLEQQDDRKQASMVVPRPGGLDSTEETFYEDGPLFRATVSSMEKKNAHLKALIKRLLKRSVVLNERQEALVDAQRVFYDCLVETSAEQNMPALQSLIHHYFNKSTPYNMHIEFNKSCASSFKSNIISPLRKLYEQDIKTFELRKKEFDDESAQYYSWLSRYLSMKQEAKGKKKVESDNKYSEKRRLFELSRFDYYSFLSDLHGGRKQLDIVRHLASYADFESSRLLSISESMKAIVRPELELVLSEINQAGKDWSRYRTQRETRRRTLEQPGRINFHPLTPNTSSSSPVYALPTTTSGNVGMPAALSDNSLSSEEEDSVIDDQALSRPKLTPIVSSSTITKASAAGTNADSSTMTSSTLSSGRAAQNIGGMHRKEGLLWAMARPGAVNDPIANLNKSAWHKYWVVLAGGKLSEYSNWKQSLDLHNEPINLRMACVREARSSDRRFCFEVVTPQYTRVYQTTSDEDMRSWIKAVDNGITTSLNQGSYNKSATSSSSNERSQQHATSKLTSSLKPSGNPKPEIRTHKSSSSLSPSELLGIIKGHPSNKICADCGVTEKVEWVSINLLVVLCIDCSGVHRSLGSHISKIRSLTLDTVSFTPELIELLRNVNNAKLNDVWERRLDKKASLINNRLSFITEKYVEKKFIQVLERPNAHLRKAVYDQDLIEILNAIANRANTNLLVTTGDTSGTSEFTVLSPPTHDTSILDATQGAVAKSSVVENNTSMSLLMYAFKCSPPDAKIFPVVELLILNGAKVPQDSELPIKSLTENQNNFLIRRAAVISRKLTVDTNASAPQGSYIPQGNSPQNEYNVVLSPEKKVGNMGAKLQKRLSAGFTTLNAR